MTLEELGKLALLVGKEERHLDRMWEVHNEDGSDHRCEPGWCPYWESEDQG